MASTSMSRCHLAIVILLLVYCQFATAFTFSKAKFNDVQAVGKQAQESANADLVALLRPVPKDPSGVFTNALELLNKMKVSPSCTRLAALTLMDSCQSLEGYEHDTQALTDEFKSIYAAQLAVCEIGSANSVKPQSCDALATVNKEQLISIYKSMVETSADASEALGRSTKEANAGLHQLQHEFALAKKNFQEDLLRDLEVSTGKAQSLLERMVNKLDPALQATLNVFTTATNQVKNETASLVHNIRQASNDSIDLQDNLQKARKQVVEASAEIGVFHATQFDHSHELASQLSESREAARLLFEAISSLALNQEHFAEQLRNFSQSFEDLRTAQNLHIESQTRAHEQLQIEMQVAQATMHDAASSAATLRTNIDSVAAMVSRFSSITAVTTWIPFVGFWILLLVILYMIAPIYALCAVATTIVLLGVYFSGVLDFLRSIKFDMASMGSGQNTTKFLDLGSVMGSGQNITETLAFGPDNGLDFGRVFFFILILSTLTLAVIAVGITKRRESRIPREPLHGLSLVQSLYPFHPSHFTDEWKGIPCPRT